MIRVGIVDDHPVVADGLAAALDREPGLAVAWTAATLDQARRQLAAGPEVDVVLLDIRLPDGSGLDLLPGRGDGGPAFLVLSSFDRPQYAAAAFRGGAVGFLLKLAPTAEIVAAVEAAAAGRLAFDARHLVAAQSKPQLSARELDVVRLVATGLSNDEVGLRLGLSRKSVEAYLTHLYQRVGITTRTELALWAEREGWLE